MSSGYQLLESKNKLRAQSDDSTPLQKLSEVSSYFLSNSSPIKPFNSVINQDPINNWQYQFHTNHCQSGALWNHDLYKNPSSKPDNTDESTNNHSQITTKVDKSTSNNNITINVIISQEEIQSVLTSGISSRINLY